MIFPFLQMTASLLPNPNDRVWSGLSLCTRTMRNKFEDEDDVEMDSPPAGPWQGWAQRFYMLNTCVSAYSFIDMYLYLLRSFKLGIILCLQLLEPWLVDLYEVDCWTTVEALFISLVMFLLTHKSIYKLIIQEIHVVN